MPLWPQFVGGTYTSRNPTMADEACINLFPVTVESQTNAKQKMLLGCPGLRPLFAAATVSCRGMFSEDGRTFAAIGAVLYELDLTANTATSRGTIADDQQPVSFASNGRGGEQLAICSAGLLYILDLDTNTFSGPITVPLTNAAVCVAFIDGYFLLLEADTVKFYFSALEDGTSWDALDFAARNQTSDNFVAMAVLRDRVFLMGSETTEIYYDSGQADTPFLPYPGAIMYEGIVGPNAWASDGTSLYWLAQNNQGRAYMVQATEGQIQPISTQAIDFAIAQAPRLEDTEALCYSQEGRTHVAWTIPTACSCGRTYVWCPEEQLWHERGEWDQSLGQFYRWRVRGIASTSAGLICGDYSDGNIYELDLETFTSNGSLIRRVRRAPYLSREAAFAFVDQFELGIQPGVGLTQGQGSDPLIMLRLSRDGGFTWTPTITGRRGQIGEYLTRCVFRRLGRVRLDRLVIEIAITDNVRVALGPGAWLRITQGTQAA